MFGILLPTLGIAISNNHKNLSRCTDVHAELESVNQEVNTGENIPGRLEYVPAEHNKHPVEPKETLYSELLAIHTASF